MADTWDERRRDEIDTASWKLSPISTDGRCYFRPWELLLGPKAEHKLAARLFEEYGAKPYVPNKDDPSDWRSRDPGMPGAGRDINEGLRAAGIGLQLYSMRRDFVAAGTAEVVRALRRETPESETDPDYGIHLNHVVFAEQIYQGGPDGPPEPCERPQLPTRS